jgi:hypothetical protein
MAAETAVSSSSPKLIVSRGSRACWADRPPAPARPRPLPWRRVHLLLSATGTTSKRPRALKTGLLYYTPQRGATSQVSGHLPPDVAPRRVLI